jgi:hypothetical protein
MIDIIIKLTDITNNNYRDKFANELLELTDIEANKERISCLQQIISNYDAAIQAAAVALVENTQTENEYSKDNVNIIAATDKIIYSREWKRLAPIHRMIKLKEYFEFLPVSSFKDSILIQLEELVNSKKLKDPEHIIYNNELQKITDIPCLSLDTEGTNISNYKCSFNL